MQKTKPSLSDKLIAIIEKGKTIEEMIEAYQKLGEHLHTLVEDERKLRQANADSLPKINNETTQ